MTELECGPEGVIRRISALTSCPNHVVGICGLDRMNIWVCYVQGGQDELVAAVLQALRWRLDHTSSSADRLQVLKAYTSHDILQLRSVG